MSLDTRYISKGKGEPRSGLMQQGRFHVGLAHLYATELADNGWSAQDTTSFAANVTKLDVATGTQAKAYDDASDDVSVESNAIDDAKSFLRRLRNALPRALRETPSAGVTLASFKIGGGSLKRSTPKIAKYLARIRPAVVSLDPALRKYFKGNDASAELDTVKAALDKADTTQELSRKQAPVETLAVYEIMGKVLEQIEDMNRAGKSAFDGDPAIWGKFNKDILDRARRTLKKETDEEKPAEAAKEGKKEEAKADDEPATERLPAAVEASPAAAEASPATTSPAATSNKPATAA